LKYDFQFYRKNTKNLNQINKVFSLSFSLLLSFSFSFFQKRERKRK